MQQGILERVVDCLEQTTRYPRRLLTPDADLADELGIDSVKQVELAVALEEAFGVKLDREQVARVRTIREIAALIPAPAPRALAPAPAPSPSPSPSPSQEVGSLDGKIILVTGSGRGIGKTIATVLAARGASVIVNSFHSREQGEATAAEIVRSGGRAVHIWGSVADEAQVDAITHEIEARFGGLDVLVCNASDGRIGAFEDLTRADWDRAFRTNVSGHHACAIRAARMMAPRGGGAIVTMSTVGATRYVRGLGSQGVVKAAVEALTRYLACELAPYNVRTNCVAAGPVYGPLLDGLAGDEATVRHWESLTPGGLLCDADDVARAVAFLASDESRAINGALWSVDRGFSAHADGRLAPQRLARAS